MCGIIAYVGPRAVVPVLLDGLKRLEYRGYDSAGIAALEGGEIRVHRRAGKLRELEESLRTETFEGTIGLGHTRWATHGRPNEVNAHPQRDSSGQVVVVHNGIVENYRELRQRLTGLGFEFASETDTEVISQLIAWHLRDTPDLHEAVRSSLKELQGAYAIAVMWAGDADTLVAARVASPLVVGVGDDEVFVASDVPALLPYTRRIIVIEDGEIVRLTRGGVVVVTDGEGELLEKTVEEISWSPVLAEKGGYSHFMQKEIFEQPRALADTIRGRYSEESGKLYLDNLETVEPNLKDIERVVLLACGTSWHAALVGKYYVEELVGIPAEVDYGSEFHYRQPVLDEKCLVVALSQSGETFDTLAAMRVAQKQGAPVVAICNVPGSTLSREAEGVLFTHAGPEIGVASTKTFTAIIAALYMLAIQIGRVRGVIQAQRATALMQDLIRIPQRIEQVLKLDGQIQELAREYARVSDFLFLGRGINYPIALEGALKLKEISYIHAEGYPAGEMKHGPIALITDEMPIVALAPAGRVYEKMISNIEEAKAREGRIIAFGYEGDAVLEELADRFVGLPATTELLSPILMAVPMQLFAYYIAVRLGCDVDQPRNLAKSVTVE